MLEFVLSLYCIVLCWSGQVYPSYFASMQGLYSLSLLTLIVSVSPTDESRM